MHILPPGVKQTDLSTAEKGEEGERPATEAGANGQRHVICEGGREGGREGRRE